MTRTATFIVGDRVWWWHTRNHMRRGTVRELDTNKTVGIEPDDARGRGLLYLNAGQIARIDVGMSS